MRHKVLGRFRSTEGATLVEFSVSCMVVFAMLFGIIDMSLIFYVNNFVSEAAREAARWASVRGSTSCTNTPNLTECNATSAQIQAYVQGLGYPGMKSSNISVTTTWKTATTSGSPATTTWSVCTPGAGVTCNEPGNAVNVQVTYPFPVGVPLVPITSITVGAVSQMVVYQ